MALLQRLVVFLSCSLCAQVVFAQNTTSFIDSKFIPSTSLGILSVWPQKVFALPEMKLYPLEVVTATSIDNFGFDVLKVERLDAVVGMPGPAGPVVAVMVTMSEPVDGDHLEGEVFVSSDWEEDRGLRYRELKLDPRMRMVFHPLDKTRFLFGTLPYVRMMASGNNQPGAVSSIVSKIKSQQAVLLALSFKALRPMLEGLAEGAKSQIPQPLAEDLSVLASNVDYIALRNNFATAAKTQILVAGQDAAAAEKLEASMRRLLTVGSRMGADSAKQQFQSDSLTDKAMQAYLDRLAKELSAMLTPKRTNDRLLIELESNTSVASIGVLTGLLLPAVQAAREAARRMQSSNNLKQIALALHNYESIHKRFPLPASRSPDGQPLLSWRVELLPYIEQGELYKQFRLDEPWDSEHNIKLLGKMPATYRHPSSVAPENRTVYTAVVGDQVGLHPEKQMGFADITDGTANTIFAVELDDQAAVPWTAPDDFRPSEQNPTGEMRFSSGVCQVAMFDGRVQGIDQNIDLQLLWGLFTRGGGENVSTGN